MSAEERFAEFLQQVQALAEAADSTAQRLRDGGLEYLAGPLEDALANLSAAPTLKVVRKQ